MTRIFMQLEHSFLANRNHRRILLPRPPQLAATNGVARAFGNLRVRPKLMVLHNLFFLLLACAAYFSVIPLFEKQVFEARNYEISLVRHLFSGGISVESLGISDSVRKWLDT